MSKTSRFSIVLSAGAIALMGLTAAAEAKRRAPPPAPRCMAAVSGMATGTGILGAGSAKARVEARANWEATAAQRYGRRYSNLNNARAVRWDCKKGAVLLAKCVVTAQPCR